VTIATPTNTMTAFEAMIWLLTRSETILKTIRMEEKPRTDTDREVIALSLGRHKIISIDDAHKALSDAVLELDPERRIAVYGSYRSNGREEIPTDHVQRREIDCLANRSGGYANIVYDIDQVFAAFPPLPRTAILGDGEWTSLKNVVSYFTFEQWETYQLKSAWLDDFTLNPAHPETGRLPVLELIDPEHLPEGYETQLCDHHSSYSVLFKIRNKLPASGRTLLKDYVRTHKQRKEDKPPERDDIDRAIDQAIQCFSNPALQGGVATRGVNIANDETQPISS